MIPERYITEWSEQAPWVVNKFIEQDLIVCRALVSIFGDAFLAEHLAFRGGTALGKLYLKPQPRYSEDIDLVQVKAEPIKETIDHLRDALAWLGEPEQKIHELLDFTDRIGDVADPWYTGDFEATWRDVLDGCQCLLEQCK